jgi:hypothetical protein
MRGRLVFAVAVAVAVAAAACGSTARGPGVAAPAGPGDFPDNPQLVHVPADTPYAFATFKPLSPEYLQRLQPLMAPVIARLREKRGGTEGPLWRVVAEELGDYAPARLERLGIKPTARMVVYGLGAYPVIRAEIASRERIEASFVRIAQRAGTPLPPFVAHAGARYTIVEVATSGYLLGVVGDQVVIAVGPREHLKAQLGLILGHERPQRALTTAWFRDYARREGFSGQGVGFVDLQRIEALVVGAAGPGDPRCRAAFDDLARLVPRIGFGYDDLSRHMISFGVVIELAPELLAMARAVVTKLPGLARLERARPIVAVAAAADLERARAFAPFAAARIRELGDRCNTSFEDTAVAIEEAGRRPLPWLMNGMRGVVIALTHFQRQGDSSQFEGFGLLQLDDPAPILALGHMLPDFTAPELDGKATPLPPLAKTPGHIAARADGIAVAVGAESATVVEELLAEKPTTAPLLLMQWDYRRFVEVARVMPGEDLQMMKALAGAFGRVSAVLDVDDRGLVMSFAVELR